MKYNKLLIVGLVLAILSCDTSQEKTKISVETDLSLSQGQFVILYTLRDGQMVATDTLDSINSNRFEKSIEIGEENFYRIAAFRTQFANLVLDGLESEVIIKFDGSSTTISGSEKSRAVREVDELMAKAQRDLQQLRQEVVQANQKGDQSTVQAIIEQNTALQKKNETALKSIIRKVTPSLAAIYGLNFLDIESNYDLFDSVTNKTFEAYPENTIVSQMKERVDNGRVLAVGQMAPDFALPDPDGVDISLLELRGKYVLLDFWASWCKPCRAENPNVVRMYEKYHGDQFEILGVSLDRNKEAWIKAISDDGLEWMHVSDLKHFNSAAAALYNVNAIPATFLVDPEGRIVGKNLRGSSLETKLEELFDSES
ncbi:MAG: TlpA family protein disulfide reductase [Cytophagales bacterium]|nr:TlpA family protein disulfide reductase [Cytophagales bacterium]